MPLDLTFTFSTSHAEQYDNWSFYRNQLQPAFCGGKAHTISPPLYIEFDTLMIHS
jgi:hypothetical protein